MAIKNLYNYTVIPALFVTPGGPEVQAGDEVRLFLDQTRNAAFPEFIDGIAQLPLKRVNLMSGECIQEGTSYTFSYESDDLLGAADHIDVCDVTEVTAVTCCVVLREGLDDEIAAREAADAAEEAARIAADAVIQADLNTWDVIELDAEAVQGAAGTAQVETATAVGTITGSGDLTVTVTSALFAGDEVLSVPVFLGDTPTVWAGRVAAAMESNSEISANFDVDNIGADFALTALALAADDATLNIAYTNDTSSGATPDATSADTVAGVAPVIGTPAERDGQHAQWGLRIWECTSRNPNVWEELVRRSEISLGGNGIADDGKVLGFDSVGGITSNISNVGGFQNEGYRITNTAGREFYWPSAAGAPGTVALEVNVFEVTPTTGFTLAVATGKFDYTYFLTPAGVLADGIFILPAAADSLRGQIVRVHSTEIITSIDSGAGVTVAGGGTISGAPVTTFAADTSYSWQCVSIAGSGTWIRLN